MQQRRLPYLGKVSIQIGRVLSQFDHKPGYCAWNLLRNISKLKAPVSVGEQSGAYSLRCSDCNVVNVGQTGRGLNVTV